MFYPFYVDFIIFFWGCSTWDPGALGPMGPLAPLGPWALAIGRLRSVASGLRGFGAAMEACGKALRWRRGMALVGQMRLVQVGWGAGPHGDFR